MPRSCPAEAVPPNYPAADYWPPSAADRNLVLSLNPELDDAVSSWPSPVCSSIQEEHWQPRYPEQGLCLLAWASAMLLPSPNCLRSADY